MPHEDQTNGIFFIYLKLNDHLICQNTAALMRFTLVKNNKKKVN